MPPTPSPRPTALPRSAVVRMAIAATLVAAMLYVVVFWRVPMPVPDPNAMQPEPALVAVPQLDTQLLATAKDQLHEQRVFLEPEPLSHLLAMALNVSDEAAQALGMPTRMVPLDELRAERDRWRGRWLYYRGTLEELTGPRAGHPVPGYGIYEATLRLDGGETLLFAFSRPPAAGIHVGGRARAEGYLLKLRDLSFPSERQDVPLLVGGSLREDFADWGPQREFDPTLLEGIVDVHRTSEGLEPTPDSERELERDQARPLWHLAAFARDREPLSLAQWRQVPPLNASETWAEFKRDRVARGTPMRLLGMLAAKRRIAAQPNPAGITEWTEAWVQISDLAGKAIPVWVPKAVDLPLGASLEVRAYYLRRRVYGTRSDETRWSPQFVAADLDPFVFDTSQGMREVGWIALSGTALLIIGAFWHARRERRSTRLGEDALATRRRRRRERAAASSGQP